MIAEIGKHIFIIVIFVYDGDGHVNQATFYFDGIVMSLI